MEKRMGDGIAISLVAAVIVFFAFQISEWVGAPVDCNKWVVTFVAFGAAMFGWVAG